jgi:RNA polymerase sigma factor (sigma-70 family)
MHPDPTHAGSVTGMIHRFQSGSADASDEAARRVWERYLPRLLTLARRHLDRRIRTLYDEEDLAQSMAGSFFHRLRRGDFDLVGRDDLWALLVAITLNKTRDAADRYLAARRDVRRERPFPSSDEGRSGDSHRTFAPDTKPGPEEAALFVEALEERLGELPEPELQRVALMKLEGYANREIADALECSERGIERKLNLIRKRWHAGLGVSDE